MNDPYYFTSANHFHTDEPLVAPGTNYSAVVEHYRTIPGAWSYSRAKVYDGPRLVCTIDRNYNSFWVSWLLGLNGCDYLLCGADYQGLTLVKLADGSRQDWTPQEASEGKGFCVYAAHLHPDKQSILLVGCFWGGIEEFHLHELSSMSFPWPLVKIIDNPDPEITVTSFTRSGEIRGHLDVLIDPETGKRRDEWSAEDIERWLNSAEAYPTITEEVTIHF